MTSFTINGDQVYSAREATFSLVRDWRQCPFNCLLRILRVPEQETARQLSLQKLGKSVENAISDGTDLQLPDEQRLQAERMVALSKQLSAKSAGLSRKQVQFRWSDPVSGYTLLAKPDEVNRLSGLGGQIIQVIDDKITWRLTDSHRGQIRFFGLVVAQSEQTESSPGKHEADIELVVRLLGTPPRDRDTGERLAMGERERKFSFSRSSQEDELYAVRKTLRSLEAARQHLGRLDLDQAELPSVLKAMQSHFPPRRSKGCANCPHRSMCPLVTGVSPDR